MIGGRISAMVEGLAVFVGPMATNSIKPLAITSPKRLPNYPDLPTVAETIPGFDSRGWFAFMALAGTPDDVVAKINADLRKVLEQPEVQQRFETLATYVRQLSPAQTAQFIRDEQAAWRPVAKQFGVAPK